LAAVGEQPMSDVEMYALRLYTGPQYIKYNTTLRGAAAGGTDADHVYQRFQQLCRGNTYANTLHVVSAAIIKLSKIAPAHKVYRAPGGALPASFWHRSAVSGVQGGLEFAFMSTTLNKVEAMKYARRAPGMILFEIDQGFVARGAAISWLSQYPMEAEVLYPPCTALEVSKTRVEGAVVVVGLRPSLSSAVAASGLRTGADDLVEFAAERARVHDDREKAHVAEEMRMRLERQRMAEERGRMKHELLYQQRMANLRLSALRRREAQLVGRLADARHDVKKLRWDLARETSSREEHLHSLQDQISAAKEVRRAAASQLRRAESQMEQSHKSLLDALEAKSRLQQSVGRRLWNILGAHVRERFRTANVNSRMFRGLTQQLRASLDMAMPESIREEAWEEALEEEAEEAPPSPPPPPPATTVADDGIRTMNAAKLVPELRGWIGPQEQWVAGKTRRDTERTMRACERLVELCKTTKERKVCLELGLLEVLGSGMRKHMEEPAVLAHAFEAMRALIAKEKAKEVQKLGRDAIPAVVLGTQALLGELLVYVVRAMTKDNKETTAYALRVGCDVGWLAEDSSVQLDEQGQVIGLEGSKRRPR